MDDEADENQGDDGLADCDDERFVEPDFRFDPNDGILGDRESDSDTLVTRDDAVSVDHHRSEEHRLDGAATCSDPATHASPSTETEDTFNLQLGIEGLGAFASIPHPSVLPVPPPTRQLCSAAAAKKSR
ncbi:hypothetical protein PRIC1_000511 [Phytophthora ramorum]